METRTTIKSKGAKLREQIVASSTKARDGDAREGKSVVVLRLENQHKVKNEMEKWQV